MRKISMRGSGEVPIPDLPKGDCAVEVKNDSSRSIAITIPADDRLMAIQVGNVVYPNPYYKRPGDGE